MPSCIDFHIKNCLKSFERTLTMETDPSDFYKPIHCVKSVCIQSYSGPHFPAFDEYEEIRSYTFYAVIVTVLKVKHEKVALDVIQ